MLYTNVKTVVLMHRTSQRVGTLQVQKDKTLCTIFSTHPIQCQVKPFKCFLRIPLAFTKLKAKKSPDTTESL